MKRTRIAIVAAGGLIALATARARAQPVVSAPPESSSEPEPINDSEGYTPAVEGTGAAPALTINGYVDVGYAKAQGARRASVVVGRSYSTR